MFNTQEIYPNIQNHTDISIRHVNPNNVSDHLCVFGILDTLNGLTIADEMLSWLTPEYDVYCVIQKAPGDLYEYPALRFAQWLSDKTQHEFILYVHTKGAFFKNPVQKMIRNLWKHEFTSEKIQNYIKELNNGYDIVCPLTGPNNQTWYNGMLVSCDAFRKIPLIKPNKDRYQFQRLFSRLKIKGLIKENVASDFLKENTIKICQDLNINNSTAKKQDYSAAIEWKKQ